MLSRLPWTPKPKATRRDRRKGLHREPIVKAIARILDAGEPTKFAFEAACRHGLRARLCLAGTSWASADKFAGEIVAEALRRLGAARPSWLEGQPDAAQVSGERRWTCAYKHCGRPIPEDRGERIGGLGVKYCSDRCAQLAADKRNQYTLVNASAAAAAAYRAARGSGAQGFTKVCIGCGETFSAPLKWRETHRQYCSTQCRDKHILKWAPRPCAVCGKTFKPVKRGNKYCSRECMGIGSVKPGGERTCKRCGTVFTVRWPCSPKQFCSRKCGIDNALAASLNAARHRQQERPKRFCQQCQAELTKHDQKTFCSRECANQFRFHRPNGFACEVAEGS